MSDEMDAFVAEAREFLEANATRRDVPSTEVEWGRGEDRITYFGDVPPEVDARKVAAAREWQRRRYDAGFGWIPRTPPSGGRGLPNGTDLVSDALEAGHDA